MPASPEFDIGHDAFAPSTYLVLLGLSFVAALLALLSQNSPTDRASLCTNAGISCLIPFSRENSLIYNI